MDDAEPFHSSLVRGRYPRRTRFARALHVAVLSMRDDGRDLLHRMGHLAAVEADVHVVGETPDEIARFIEKCFGLRTGWPGREFVRDIVAYLVDR